MVYAERPSRVSPGARETGPESRKPRDTGIKVIGAGLPRTGTLSQKAALERLGFGPCFHMGEVFKDPKRARDWYKAALAGRSGEPIEWGRLLGGYGATTDWPGSFFWEELAREYPDAKVVLSVRDPEKWYESVLGTIYRVRRSLSRVLPLVPVLRWLPKMLDEIWSDVFGPDFEDRGRTIAAFERHSREVRERVPAERLLVYEVRQGWEPLCRFLGVEVPDEPFPHVNSSADRRWMLRGIEVVSYAVPLAAGALAGAALLRVARSDRAFHLLDATKPATQRLKMFGLPLLFQLVSRPRPLQRRIFWFLSQLRTSYRDSPAVTQAGAIRQGPKPGDRAPYGFFEAGPDAGTSVFGKLVGTRHHLLLFEGTEADSVGLGAARAGVEGLLERYEAPVEILPVPQGNRSLHGLYGAKKPSLFLIRPDGHVAYRGEANDILGFKTYLDSLFVGWTDGKRTPAAVPREGDAWGVASRKGLVG